MSRLHHPPHLVQDNAWHMVSASTVGGERFLGVDGAKEIVRDALRELVQQEGIPLLAWVILDNHYHLVLKPVEGRMLAEFLRRLHGRTARQVNLLQNCRGRQIWHNYWDSAIRSEGTSVVWFNYVHQNPVKHGYVALPEEWPFSSYGYYLRTRGEEWLYDCWRRYPVVDYMQGDRF